MNKAIYEALLTGVMNTQRLDAEKLGSTNFFSCTRIANIAATHVPDKDEFQLNNHLKALGEKYANILQDRLNNGEYCKSSLESPQMHSCNTAFIHAFCRRIAPSNEWDKLMYGERVAWLSWLETELKEKINESI